MRSLIDISELTPTEIEELIATADDIIADPAKYSEKCKGKKLATLFFEPSTRTRLSFEGCLSWAAACSAFPRLKAPRLPKERA